MKKPKPAAPARPVHTTVDLHREDYERLRDLCSHERLRAGAELIRLLIRRAHAALPKSERTV